MRRASLPLLLTLLLSSGCMVRPVNTPAPPPVPVVATEPAPQAAAPALTAFATSPQGTLAIGTGNSFLLMDPQGRTLQRQDLGSPVAGFTWSPSGRQLIIITADDRRWLAPKSGEAKPLNLPEGAVKLAWSPDETQLLLGEDWAGAKWSCTVWLYTLADGSSRELGRHDRLITLSWQDAATALVQLYAGGGHSTFERRLVATWDKLPGGSDRRGIVSPDQRTLVFNPSNGAELTLVDLVSGKAYTVWRGKPPGVSDGYITTYSMEAPVIFTPDSERFAYTVQRTQPPYLGILRIADRAGHDELVTEAQAGAMTWSPGGELLYATAYDGGITVMLGRTKLGDVPGAARLGALLGRYTGGGAWSPDSRQVAFAIQRPDDELRLMVAQGQPAAVQEVPNGKDLVPLAWVGGKVLAVEAPHYKTATQEGRRIQGLWLIDPVTGDRYANLL